jgi:hypothetical protein
VRFGGQEKASVFAYSPNAVQDLPNDVENLDRPVVFHLFGKLSAVPAYAVTEEDTLEFVHALQSETREPQLLFDELNRNNLLILGGSFGGWLARFFLRTAKRQRLLMAHGSTDYVADTTVSDDDDLVLFLRHFSSRTKIFQGGGPVEFVNELHQRWVDRHPSTETEVVQGAEPLSAPTEMEPGAVFLSYASEDRSAVQAIKEALEAVGIDVFFDKDDLKVGDDFEAKLRRSISECSLFVPVISHNTLTKRRRFFRIEWNQALDEALKVAPSETFIVPVVIDDTAPEEPAVPERFRKLHWEPLPGGQASPRFVATVRNLFRKYQKQAVGAS